MSGAFNDIIKEEEDELLSEYQDPLINNYELKNLCEVEIDRLPSMPWDKIQSTPMTEDNATMQQRNECYSTEENVQHLSKFEENTDIFKDVSDTNWTKSYSITCGKFFKVTDIDKTKVKCMCLICPSEPRVLLSADLSTCGNLITHLKRRHPDRYCEFAEYRKNKTKRRHSNSPRSLPPSKKECKIIVSLAPDEASCHVKQHQLDKKIMSFVIDGMYPLSIVENEKFKDLFSDYVPTITMMSRRSLELRILQKAKDIWEKIKADLLMQSHLCMTVDALTTNHRTFMGFTVHWIDENSLERCSATLSCKRFKGPLNGESIADLMDDIKRTFSIPRYTIKTTRTDNGTTNFIKGFKEFGIALPPVEDEDIDALPSDVEEASNIYCSRLELKDEDVYLLPRCESSASHILSLIYTQDMASVLKGSLATIHLVAFSKCSALWKLSRHPKSAEIIQNILKCPLTVPCGTKLDSLCVSVMLLLQHKNVLNNLTNSLQLPSFSDTDIKFLEEYTSVIKPIALAFEKLHNDKYYFYGTLLPILLAVEQKLKRVATFELKYTYPLLVAITTGFENRFGEFLRLDPSKNDAILAATCFPKFKLKWLSLKPEINTDSHRNKYQEMLISTVRIESCVQPVSVDNNNSDDFYEYENLPTASPIKDAAELEVLQYLRDGDHSLESLHKYPSVKKVFLCYNATLLSSTPVESSFKFEEFCQSLESNKLSDKMFEAFVIVKGNSCYQ